MHTYTHIHTHTQTHTHTPSAGCVSSRKTGYFKDIYIYICCYWGYIFDNCFVVWWGCKENWVWILALTSAISDGFLIHLSLIFLVYNMRAATRTSWHVLSSSEIIRQIKCLTSGKSSVGDRSYCCYYLYTQKPYFLIITRVSHWGESTTQELQVSKPKTVGLPGGSDSK